MVLDAPIGRHRLAAGVEFAVPLCRTSSVAAGEAPPWVNGYDIGDAQRRHLLESLEESAPEDGKLRAQALDRCLATVKAMRSPVAVYEYEGGDRHVQAGGEFLPSIPQVRNSGAGGEGQPYTPRLAHIHGTS